MEWLSGWHPSELWIVGAVVLLMLELLIPTFFVGSFGVSAFAAAGVAGLGANLPWQIVTFAVLGAALVFPARKFFLRQSPELKMSVDDMKSRRGVCVESIEGDLHPGVVRVTGARWTAVAAPGVVIGEGQHVEVRQRDGVKLIVAPTV